MRKIVLLCGLVLLVLLAGCAPLAEAFPTITPVDTATSPPPTATLTPTATIDWFPATETPTPRPTQSPTPTLDLKPGIGSLTYEDDFTEPGKWLNYQIPNSSVSVINGDATLRLDQPRGQIYSFRAEPLMADFYAEITASPSYCGAEDEYGLMIRVTGLRRDHYRVGLNCAGQAVAYRVVNDGNLQIVKPVDHPLLPKTFPSTVRMAVWIQGRTLRFFIDDVFIFEVVDSVILRGSVGVFARANSADPLLVNFSELQVYDLVDEE